MTKILILTAAFGEGHNTAARNIQAGLAKEGKGEVDAVVHDLYETVYPRLTSGLQKGYKFAIHKAPSVWRKIYDVLDSPRAIERTLFTLRSMKKELQKMVREQKPAAIVSTYPVYNYLLDRLYKDEKPFRQFTMITDAITINSAWYRCAHHRFLVTDSLTAGILGKVIPSKWIEVTGFPVSDKFDHPSPETVRQIPSKDSPPRVLFMIHTESVESLLAVEKLLALENLDLTVWVGRNVRLRKRVAGLIAESGRAASILGWTQRMPEMLLKSHLVIGKAGGATVQEAVAARCPMLVSQIIPGQEEGNLRLILENEMGGLAVTATAIADVVKSAFENNAALWHTWSRNIEKVRKAEPARGIARLILKSIASK